jgi:hypothetical protein
MYRLRTSTSGHVDKQIYASSPPHSIGSTDCEVMHVPKQRACGNLTVRVLTVNYKLAMIQSCRDESRVRHENIRCYRRMNSCRASQGGFSFSVTVTLVLET